MLYKTGYVSWDFANIWTIDEGNTIGYLKNVVKPDQVKTENITYQAFGIEGNGTSLNPYIIKTAVQLQKVNENLEAYYKLGADIDLTGVTWTPIGNTSSYPFKGTLDGNGYTISNLNINSSNGYQGLFGYNSGTIKSIKLNNCSITGTTYLGTLVANNLGTINNCVVTNSNVTGTSYTGGLIGYNSGTVGTSTFSGTTSGTSYVGGLIGYTIGNVTGSRSEATVSGTDSIGGLIGYIYANNSNITIDSSEATGNVQGATNIGGLIGSEFIYHTYAADSVSYSMYINKSYASGNVTGTGDNVGGLIGYQESGINVYNHYENIYSYIQECYATGKVSSTGNNVGGLIGYMHSYERLNSAYIHNSYASVQNSFATGEVIGAANVGGLVGYGYRQCTYNHTYQQAYLEITNSYAIGKVTATGEDGGLIGQLASTYNGATTTTNSYWTPETTLQQDSKAGIKKNIQTMLYRSGYISWNFDNIWKIDEGTSIAYLRNTDKPDSVNKENIEYQAFGIEGRGTTLDPYIIKTAVQLQKVNENLEAYYKLGADIDLNGVTWTPIGNTSSYPFKGTLDGNGYTINNLNINTTGNNIGLFGYNQGTLQNVRINNFNVQGVTNVGGLVGYNLGTITNCIVGNGNVQGTTNVGGLIGYTTVNLAAGNSSAATVQGTTNVGGLIGYVYANNTNITINNSEATGNVTGTTCVGGLIGSEFIYHTYGADSVTYSMYIKRCYASGNVTGTGDNVGGLVGYQQSGINVTNHYEYSYSYIQECYATRKSIKYRK